jgi:Fibronectin type III-like domain
MEKAIQDNPAFATFPSPLNQHPSSINYAEGIFVGYRGYEKKGIAPLFPFGFGLSYTTFAYSGLTVTPSTFDGTTPVTATFTVTNTGKLAGAEVAELYVGQANPSISRPIKELKGFQKVFLQPGQSQTVTIRLNQRSFAYFNANTGTWDALPGTYNVLVGASSQNTPLAGTVTLPKLLSTGPSNSPLSVSGVVNSHTNPWWGEDDVILSATQPITALAINISVAKTPGVTFFDLYTNGGGYFTSSVSDNGSALVYTYNLISGQAVAPGSVVTAGAQFNSNGTVRPTVNDTYQVTATIGGTPQTVSSHF